MMEKVRTQIYLEKWQYENLKRKAFEMGISFSELIRMVIREMEGKGKKRKGRMKRAFLFVGKGKDEKTDVSWRHDKYL